MSISTFELTFSRNNGGHYSSLQVKAGINMHNRQILHNTTAHPEHLRNVQMERPNSEHAATWMKPFSIGNSALDRQN